MKIIGKLKIFIIIVIFSSILLIKANILSQNTVRYLPEDATTSVTATSTETVPTEENTSEITSESTEITPDSTEVTSETTEITETTQSPSELPSESETSAKDSSEKETEKEVAENKNPDRLTAEERKKYDYWIKFRNSMNFNTNQLAKLSRSYKPEESSYKKTLLVYSWLPFLLASIFGVLLILYLIGRFALNWFRGPKTYIDENYKRFSWLLLFIGLVGTVTFLAFTFFYSNRV